MTHCTGREADEDYGDYITRCVCGFKHDDGYMIACDGCRYSLSVCVLVNARCSVCVSIGYPSIAVCVNSN